MLHERRCDTMAEVKDVADAIVGRLAELGEVVTLDHLYLTILKLEQ